MNTLPTRPADDPRLLSLHDSDALAQYLREERKAIEQRVRCASGGLETAHAYSQLVDGVLRRMLALACAEAGRATACDSIPIAVVATGGYGRRELCPHSDIDLTFIPHRDGDPVVDRIVKEMFTQVMRVFIDANGMTVGYAYRLIEDCGSLDHQTSSGLLDARLVAGSDRLFIQFENEFWSLFNPADFIFTKTEERKRKREKAGASPRVVEPDIKEGAGGLRDLHTAVWMTQARRTLPAARVRGDRAWETLIREGEITQEEADQLAAAKEFLFRVRNALHVATSAERDQLVVTRQEEVAEMLGYDVGRRTTDDGPRLGRDGPSSVVGGPSSDSDPPVERFMRDYYGHASAVHRIAGNVMRRAERSRLFLGIGLDCAGRELTPAGPALASDDPAWMLWACELAQKYDLGFGEEMERAVIDLLQIGPVIQDSAQAGEVFTRILASPRGAYPILQRMADLGILGWLIPEFGETMNLIPYDPSHDYTVGQHTLYVIRNLDALRATEGPEETRDFRQIMAELAHPEQLILAALLHDAGKSDADRPHSEAGEEMADRVCRRLGWSEEAATNVRFLIRHHLQMSETSRLRDLNLDETIRDFTSVVDDLDRLNMLYLLTYADTSAVGAGVWTQVQGKFLRDLHRRAERAIAGDEPAEVTDAELTRARRRLLKELAVENLPPEEVEEHVAAMPAPYILNSSLSDMALHIGFVRRARRGEPTVDFVDERDGTFTEVTVCAVDDPEPGLLAKIAGVFYAADVDVHSAQVFTRIAGQERIAIDTFTVDFRGRQLTPGKRKEIATNLTAVLTGATTVASLLAKRRRQPEIGGPVERLNVRNDLSSTFTVVEVSFAEDRAMLFRASGALSALHLDIHSARVSHFKGRPVASFYVAGAKSISDAETREALIRLMPLVTD